MRREGARLRGGPARDRRRRVDGEDVVRFLYLISHFSESFL
jgi:hypothetical protein